MNRPLVSVVMPVYNAEKYLKPAIDSILNQSYPDLDIVIVNDGSTDDSKNIIKSYQDPRIRYFENARNSGIVVTRNRGLEEARGDYIAVMDSDDLATPDRMKIQVEFLENNQEFGMCGSYFKTINGQDKILKTVNFPTNDKDARSYLIVHNCFCHSTVMIRGELAKRLKYDLRYDVVEDYELWYRISKISKIINLPVYTTFYRVHGNNVSTTKNKHMFILLDKINSNVLDDLEILYTRDELSLHSNLLIYNFSFFKDKGKLDELEKWMVRFFHEIEKNPNFSEIIVYKILIKKWIVVCTKSKDFKKLLFNKLLFKHPSLYLNILVKKIRGKN
jgi:glycosyltransferase involved in cell wall biosynthesis